MNNRKIAILLTCYNRKDKTLTCLSSFYKAHKPNGYYFDIFLTDDCSTDGTNEAVKEHFPSVKVIKGTGNLFWAGGMRLAWNIALENDDYSAFLLLNDDVELESDFLINLIATEEYSVQKNGRKGIYSGATIDNITKEVTYGSSKKINGGLITKFKLISPTREPQSCDLTNANILWVDKSVVSKIGILDDVFTHGLADYDYSLRAIKNNIPVLLAPNICGQCNNDHGNTWLSSNTPLRERIKYLRSPKGLAFREYMFYLKRHFPKQRLYYFIMIWLKTFFPDIWDKLK